MKGGEKTEDEGKRGLRPSSLTPSLNRGLLIPYAKQVHNSSYLNIRWIVICTSEVHLQTDNQPFSFQAGVVLQTCMTPPALLSANCRRKRGESQRTMKMKMKF